MSGSCPLPKTEATVGAPPAPFPFPTPAAPAGTAGATTIAATASRPSRRKPVGGDGALGITVTPEFGAIRRQTSLLPNGRSVRCRPAMANKDHLLARRAPLSLNPSKVLPGFAVDSRPRTHVRRGREMTRNTADRLVKVGLSHRSAPLDLLERVAVRRDALPDVLCTLRRAGYGEAVVVSTCSRTEIYALAGDDGPRDLARVLERRAGEATTRVRDAAEILTGEAVVAHLFRVTAGFESPVLGEVDVHGQVRSAYRMAQAAAMTPSLLGRLFPAALHCSMQVRAHTGLDAHGRSLARKAVEVGLRECATADPRILVVGSGQMATTAVQHLHSAGLSCRVAARDEAYAARLVGDGLVCPIASLGDEIRRTDVLICATSAAHHVVTTDHVRGAMTGRESRLTVIDLAVPRNVDTAVAAIDGVRLIDLTGLHDAATDDPELLAMCEAGSAMIADAVGAFLAGIAARDAGPVIAALRQKVEATCLAQLTSRAAPETPAKELAKAAHTFAGKLLHAPTLLARRAAANGDTDTLVRLCEMFGVATTQLDLPRRAEIYLPQDRPVDEEVTVSG